jgi:hypothetical protein
MAKRVKPPFLGAKGKVKAPAKAFKAQAGPTLKLLTVLWVTDGGVPYDTTGFNAALYRGSALVQTARFDRYGTVYFSRVATPTTVAYTLRLYDQSGRVYRTCTVPAGVAAFAVIG